MKINPRAGPHAQYLNLIYDCECEQLLNMQSGFHRKARYPSDVNFHSMLLSVCDISLYSFFFYFFFQHSHVLVLL